MWYLSFSDSLIGSHFSASQRPGKWHSWVRRVLCRRLQSNILGVENNPGRAVAFFKKRFYLFIFRERGREAGRGGEKHWCGREHWSVSCPSCPQPRTWPATQACALTGNWTSELSVCRTVPNPLRHTSQGKQWCFYVSNENHWIGYF